MASDLLAGVENGQLVSGTSVATETVKKVDNSLGKEAFLQLLVAQMQYQDPLNPNTDTQFVAQLAQFSSLEQMQNLAKTSLNSQAFSLVGKEVVVRLGADATSDEDFVQGTVDYVTIRNGEAKLSINNELYPIDDLYTVVDESYAISKLVPTVEEYKANYEHSNPTDLQVKISLGKEDYEASSVAAFINGEVIDSKYLAYDENTNLLTISKEAFRTLDAGTYKVGFLFDDVLATAVTDKVSLTVTGIKPEIEEEITDETNATEDSVEDATSEAE